MTLLLRPVEGFSQPDFSVIERSDDGTERDVGRVYYSVAVSSDPATRWFWAVYGQPHGGLVGSLDEAKAAFRRCWDFCSAR